MFTFWPKRSRVQQPTTTTANSVNEQSDPLDGVITTSFQYLMRLRFSANLLSMPSAKRGLRQQTGGHLSKFKGRGMEFAEVRLYQPGDDIKSIDWRVTARRQKPHTKLFHEERERPVLILCDQSMSQFFGSTTALKSVKAAEIASLIAWTTLKHGDRVGGLIFSDKGHLEIRPARSRKTATRYVKAVSEFNGALLNRAQSPKDDQPSTRFTLENALLECRQLSKPGALIIIVSDFAEFSPACTKLLHAIRAHGDIIAIQTFDELERELPPPGEYPITDGDQQILLNTNSQSLRDNFKKAISDKQQFLELALNNLRIPLIPMATSSDTTATVQKHFRQGGLL
jgi:hypothetical protein